MNAPGRDAGLLVHDVPLLERHDSSAVGATVEQLAP
jgi:hypothetical protein